MKSTKKVLAGVFFFLSFAQGLFSYPLFTGDGRQPHNGAVNSLVNTDKSFFTGGADGFLVEWEGDGFGKRYQISSLSVNSIKKNPQTLDFAVYESDGFSVNRVFLFDWKNQSKVYSKNFDDKVKLLSFSQRGKFLFAGTEKILYMYDAKSGKLISQIDNLPFSVTLVKTGDTEKSAIFYSESGFLIYYDLIKQKVLKKINVEEKLEDPQFYTKYLVGVKDKYIYLIDTKNGSVLFKENFNPIKLSTAYFNNKDTLFFLNRYKNNLFKINSIVFTSGSPKITTLAEFSGDKGDSQYTGFCLFNDNFFITSEEGNIYKVSDNKLKKITGQSNIFIEDIASDSRYLYILTEDMIYKGDFCANSVLPFFQNNGQKNIVDYNDKLLLWTKNTKNPVQLISKDSGNVEVLIKTKKKISNLKIILNKLVYILDKSDVYCLDLSSKKSRLLYSGTSIEDLALIGQDKIYIAKTKSNENDSSIICINLKTEESVPIMTAAFVSYSLCFDTPNFKSPLYGISVVKEKDFNKTSLFVFSSQDNTDSKEIFTLKDENIDAFSYFSYPFVYTNLDGYRVYSYDVTSGKSLVYRRYYSLPKKIQALEDNIVLLGKDGSLCWYKKGNQLPISVWYLNADGSWYEF